MHGGEERPVHPSDSPRQTSALADRAPSDDAFTAYDEANFAVYLSLLHASAEGLSPDEICRCILKIDPTEDPTRATTMLQSHLDRARWFSAGGHAHMLEVTAVGEANP